MSGKVREEISVRGQILALLLLVGSVSWGQVLQESPHPAPDPCGYPDSVAGGTAGPHGNWGYGYDSLKADLERWGLSTYASVESVGTSVQGRTLWLLTITAPDGGKAARHRVWIHARTHPAEVQGTWVTNEVIDILLGETPLARMLRDSCVVNILPMLNPDGVELGRSRQNANGVDLESNWAVVPGEQEVQVLRSVFERMMAEENPIRIALNMHSSVSCVRYFVYHAESGTSPQYAEHQRSFITGVGSHFPGGIRAWDYFVSWANGAPTVYPESWFWYNHGSTVLALTYEDMNCSTAGAFDSTAYALLHGVAEDLGLIPLTAIRVLPAARIPGAVHVAQNYPNPFNSTTTIHYSLSSLPGDDPLPPVRLAVYDLVGREVGLLVDERKLPGDHAVRWSPSGLASGVYVCQLVSGTHRAAIRMILLN